MNARLSLPQYPCGIIGTHYTPTRLGACYLATVPVRTIHFGAHISTFDKSTVFGRTYCDAMASKWKCTICGHEFTNGKKKNLHLEVVHNRSAWYRCPAEGCTYEKTGDRVWDVIRHMTAVHPPEVCGPPIEVLKTPEERAEAAAAVAARKRSKGRGKSTTQPAPSPANPRGPVKSRLGKRRGETTSQGPAAKSRVPPSSTVSVPPERNTDPTTVVLPPPPPSPAEMWPDLELHAPPEDFLDTDQEEAAAPGSSSGPEAGEYETPTTQQTTGRKSTRGKGKSKSGKRGAKQRRKESTEGKSAKKHTVTSPQVKSVIKKLTYASVVSKGRSQSPPPTVSPVPITTIVTLDQDGAVRVQHDRVKLRFAEPLLIRDHRRKPVYRRTSLP